MRGERYITKAVQYAEVYNKGSSRVDKLVVMKIVPNGLELSRYGFSISRRVGKAVVRNRVRRLFREVVRPIPVKPGWDIVLIARPAAGAADYRAIQGSVVDLLSRHKILADKYEGIGPGAN